MIPSVYSGWRVYPSCISIVKSGGCLVRSSDCGFVLEVDMNVFGVYISCERRRKKGNGKMVCSLLVAIMSALMISLSGMVRFSGVLK